MTDFENRNGAYLPIREYWKRRNPSFAGSPHLNIDTPYAEFAVQSNFSFLRGASKPEELAVTAKMLGLSTLGLADRNTVAGVVRAWQQAKEARIAYHPGCRLVFSDGTPDILAYPRDRQGWGHLCRML